ncbi:MAG: translation elongation factor Ts [Lysobacterales bacterium]
MAVTASMVKDLRERTGVGMMECKKALVEAGGDMDAAAELLRKIGLAQADKKASRIAAEGKVVLATNDDSSEAVLVEINCETDFVAKDAGFQAFANKVAGQALEMATTDVEAVMAAEVDGESLEVARQNLITKIGENIQVRRAFRIASDDTIGAYIHGGHIGVMVEVEGGDEEVAHDVAMHIAAMNPSYVDVDDVPADVLEKEKRFLVSQAEDSGKPADIIEKMVAGRMRKHLSTITLLGQDFVKDGDITVAKLLQQKGAKVKGFTRVVVGEGLEKRNENFADEVAQQMKSV